jgi:hypothetical protein
MTVDKNASADDSDKRSIDDDKIMISVCTETGLVASPSCPHVETMRVDPGKQPLEMCGPEHHSKTLVRSPTTIAPIRSITPGSAAFANAPKQMSIGYTSGSHP